MSKEAMKLALEALHDSIAITMAKIDLRNKAIKALEEAPAKQEQGEPVAYVNGDALDNMLDDRLAFIQRTKSGYRATPLYTTPQQRKPLTDEQENKAAMKLAECMDYPWTLMPKEGKQKMRAYAKEIIEAAHDIKE